MESKRTDESRKAAEAERPAPAAVSSGNAGLLDIARAALGPAVMQRKLQQRLIQRRAAATAAAAHDRDDDHDDDEDVEETQAPVQAKLAVGPEGDACEQEADRVAAQVISMPPSPAAGPVTAAAVSGTVQGDAGGAAGAGAADLGGRVAATRGQGDPLPGPTRDFMEPRFGVDFGSVRLHSDGNADELSRSVGARAFTTGSDIYFRSGELHPGSSSDELLAHELTHVVQQSGGQGRAQRKPAEGAAPVEIRESPSQATVQRDVVKDWVDESTVKRKNDKDYTRSKSLKLLDAAVAIVAGAPVADHAGNIIKLQKALDSLAAWRRTKGTKASRRDAKINELRGELDRRLLEQQQAKLAKQQELEVAEQRKAEFQKMDPQAAQFAGRTPDYKKAERFTDAALRDRQRAMIMPRGANNQLSHDAIQEMDRISEADAAAKIEEARTATFTVDPLLNKTQVEQVMTENKNKVTDSTALPELKSFTEPTGAEDKEEERAVAAGGATFTITCNPSDALLMRKIANLQAAAAKVAGAGFQIPALRVFMPKFGRSISIRGDCKVEAGAGGGMAGAEFIAPNHLLIGSAKVDNPEEAKTPDGHFQFLSTQLDPSGVGTMVHELGHCMHYTLAPGKFHNLSFSIFTGVAEDGKPRQQWAAEQVSSYGSGNPREFVAEVFLGLIYGKVYPAAVIEVYRAFGGPMMH